MTTRLFRAAGTLACALVVLAGCDSADSGGLAPTADLTPTISGPASVRPGALCTYYLTDATTTGWLNGVGLSNTASTPTYATYSVTGASGSTTFVRTPLVGGGVLNYPISISSSAPGCLKPPDQG